MLPYETISDQDIYYGYHLLIQNDQYRLSELQQITEYWKGLIWATYKFSEPNYPFIEGARLLLTAGIGQVAMALILLAGMQYFWLTKP